MNLKKSATHDSKKTNNFDGLRLIAALLVLFSHMFALSGRWEPRFVGDHSFGNLGVLIFFSISGYLVTGSWASDSNVWRFLLRRFLRIAPGLMVASIITHLVVAVTGLSGFPGNPLHAHNGSLWTIPCEIECYFLICGLSLLTRKSALILMMGMLAAYAFQPFSFLTYFGLFFTVGALLQQYPYLRTLYALIGFAIISTIFFLLGNTIIGLAFVVPPVTLWIGVRSWPILNTAGVYGDLSYGIYIYAWPLQQIIVATLGANTDYTVLLIPTLAITILSAFLSWHLVEHPALQLKPTAKIPAIESHTLLSFLINIKNRQG